MYKNNAPKETFDKYGELILRLRQISSIIQNSDSIITEEEYQSWFGQVNNFLWYFDKLINETDEYLEKIEE